MANRTSSWQVRFEGESTSDLENLPSECSRSFNEFVSGLTSPSGDESPQAPHIELMKEKGLFDYDDFADAGHLRSYPQGKLIRDLVTDLAEDILLELGSMPVETPVMYNLDVECVNDHAASFKERQYRFTSENQNMMLRFASDFGHFSLLRDTFLSKNDFPVKIHEICTYAFRKEQRGELSGLHRLRSFTMPDMHTLVKSRDQAFEEMVIQLESVLQVEEHLNLSYEVVFRVTEEFYNSCEALIASIEQTLDRPLLIETLDEKHHYWDAKLDFAFVDGLGNIIEGPTLQFDSETAEKFDISYSDGEQQHYPTLLHFSPTGSIERAIAATLENSILDRNPHLPEWLAPTQVRLIPVSDEHLEYCSTLADELESSMIRVEIDDRNETVGKRVQRAEKDWAAFYSVIGDDEVGSGEINRYSRSEDLEKSIPKSDYCGSISKRIDGFPTRKRYTDRLVSDQVTFSN
ncbi:threonine--tRNA ligase [Haloferax larsenii]|uniref:threonine--tRNA ligase n=1 Tax=Haloferax larsenii TaxID=302484 RepID=A0A1H7UCK4_HALLR|nr:threonine--tRNA ligase [Haloferax larsenii]SEL94549.1 threonyl-tRNA synthetase [Haloferax larsenii]